MFVEKNQNQNYKKMNNAFLPPPPPKNCIGI